MLDWGISVLIFWPIWCVSLLKPLFLSCWPHHCCLSKECRDPQARHSSALIYWFLFLRYHDPIQCCTVNYYWCKSLKGCAGLEIYVDDILGVIGLINWRSVGGMFGLKQVCFIIFSFQKSPALDISCLFFRLMFCLFSLDLSPKH